MKKTRFYKTIALFLSMFMIITVFAGCGGGGDKPPTGNNEESDGPGVPSTEVYEFRLAHFWPASHVIETEVAQGWSKAVYEASDGRIIITSFPAETLSRATEIYEGVVEGVADIGISIYAYTRGRFPVLETLLLPGVSFYNSEASSWAAMEAIAILDPVELHDVHHVWTWGSGPADLVSKKPIRTLEDLKGLQIGATAGPRADGLQALGATPVIMPMSEWYEALSRGVMDGGVTPLETLVGFRLGEVTADYVTLTPFLYNQLFFNVMNKESWNKLPADLQQIFTDATAEFYAATIPKLWDRINATGYQYALELKDVDVTVLSPEETERWVAFLPPIQDAYVTFLNDRGLPGEEILQTMKGLADKYNAQYPAFAPYITD